MEFKPITKAGVPAALQKAERYRLLNDSSAAESICHDVLRVEPENQQALVMLLLAITDQFGEGNSSDVSHEAERAKKVLPSLSDPYKRAYYAGVIAERRAKALLRAGGMGGMGAQDVAHDGLHDAMRHYEEAEKIRPAGNDEAILRWNTCARLLDRHERPRATRDEFEPALGE